MYLFFRRYNVTENWSWLNHIFCIYFLVGILSENTAASWRISIELNARCGGYSYLLGEW